MRELPCAVPGTRGTKTLGCILDYKQSVLGGDCIDARIIRGLTKEIYGNDAARPQLHAASRQHVGCRAIGKDRLDGPFQRVRTKVKAQRVDVDEYRRRPKQ